MTTHNFRKPKTFSLTNLNVEFIGIVVESKSQVFDDFL